MKISEEFLGQILSRAPSSETVLLLLENLKEEGRIDTVIREAIQALGRYPGDIRIRGLLAEACLQHGWLSRAESEVDKATAQIEDLVPIYKLKSQIYSSLNRMEEALQCLEIYQAHRPDDEEAVALLQKLRPAQETPPAPVTTVEPPAEYPQESPPFAIPQIATPTLAEVYFAQGQIREAISTYEKVLLQNPEAGQSRTRLEELKGMLAPTPTEEPGEPLAPTEEPCDPGVFTTESADPVAERLRRKKEKLIHVLETWKESIAQPM